MKTVITTLFFFLITSLCFNTFAQIYVNGDANGINDGSSWVNAYTDLKDALVTTPTTDTIWVAQGIYKPDGMDGDTAATFLIDTNLVMLGGFAGTGVNPDERNPELYETVLSGDLNGNDMLDSFNINREDNVMTVVMIDSSITNATLIDGFTIRNGHADGQVNDQEQKGGAIYSQGSPIISSCRFEQNYAEGYGGAVYVLGQFAQGITFENCHFTHNQVSDENSYGGAMYVLNVGEEGIKVFQSIFSDNQAGWTGGISFFNSNGLFDGVEFSNNVSPRQAGALRYRTTGLYTDAFLTILNSSFDNNSAAFGAGVYFLMASNDSDIIINNTSFTENATAGVLPGWSSGGSGICFTIIDSIANTNFSLSQCTFENNTTEGSGGGAGFNIYDDALNTNLSIEQCSFNGNEANLNGGGIKIYAASSVNQTNIQIDSCTLTNNNSLNNGGGFDVGLGSDSIDFDLTNSTFIENSSAVYGGSSNLWAWGEGVFNINNCLFKKNVSMHEGGLAIGVASNTPDIVYTISHCDFIENEAFEYSGGLDIWAQSAAVFVVENCNLMGNKAGYTGGGLTVTTNIPDVDVSIRDCRLTNNQAPFGAAIGADPYLLGGSLNTQDANINFENCLIAENDGEGGGAAVIISQTGNFEFVNCTIAKNEANGIMLLDEFSAASIKNTILYNPDFIEFQGDGVELVSEGGNLILDNSLNGSNSNDIEEANPDFVESGDSCEYFQLSQTSPAIDMGVEWDYAPDLDMCGNTRIQYNAIDIGALESPFQPVSVKEVITDILLISPNPAFDFLNIQLPETNFKPIKVSIFDLQGKLMNEQLITFEQMIKVKDLAPGMYILKAVKGKHVYNGKFIKG